MTLTGLQKSLGVLSSTGLSPQQFFILVYAEDSSPSMSEIAKETDHTTAAVTGIVDRMVEDGLLEREHSKEDRRVIRVYTTAKGKKILNNVCNQIKTHE